VSNPERKLALFLRAIGCLDLLAVAAVVMPRPALDLAHTWAGLEAIPLEPIVWYLARSASALYVLHGAIVVFISIDVLQYERLIRFMAFATLLHGAVLFGIDVAEGMPPLWRFSEGPVFAATGLIVLWLQRRQQARGGRQPSGTVNSACSLGDERADGPEGP
jgi:hypothetical protein